MIVVWEDPVTENVPKKFYLRHSTVATDLTAIQTFLKSCSLVSICLSVCARNIPIKKYIRSTISFVVYVNAWTQDWASRLLI